MNGSALTLSLHDNMRSGMDENMASVHVASKVHPTTSNPIAMKLKTMYAMCLDVCVVCVIHPYESYNGIGFTHCLVVYW